MTCHNDARHLLLVSLDVRYYPTQNKMICAHLTFEERKWILKCSWKTEDIEEVERSGEMSFTCRVLERALRVPGNQKPCRIRSTKLKLPALQFHDQ
jgi:hypothetical protein